LTSIQNTDSFCEKATKEKDASGNFPTSYYLKTIKVPIVLGIKRHF
jgi:hypothetical protein